MNFWTSFAFLRLTIFLIGGILFYLHAPWDIPRASWVLVTFSAVYLALVFSFSKKLRRRLSWLVGSVGLSLVFLFGYVFCELKNPLSSSEHFLHSTENTKFFVGEITSEVTEKGKTRRFVLSLEKVQVSEGWKDTRGQVQVYVALTDSTKLAYSDKLLFKGFPREVSAPLNPAEFDYKSYLARQGIFHQHYAPENSFRLVAHGEMDFLGFAYQMRRKCEAVFREYIPDKASQEIVVALILGIKEGLDNEIKDAYSGAGAMHVLAVSGLHVGIIFQVLSWLLSGLRRKKRGKLLFAFLILASLWFYAMLTGLSPSVMRAVTMFSLVVVGQAFSRRTNIYNTLSVAAFILLCYDPMMLTQVGFQLSFAAVFGIVFFHPKFYDLLEFDSKILDAVWSITCVSLAAQLATGPISMFYFHQFPSYFWLANLIVIPAAAVILYAGLSLLALSFVPMLASGIGFLLSYFVFGLNFLIDWIFHLPFSQITQIHLTGAELVLLYALVFLVGLFWVSYKFRWLIGLSAVTLLLSSLSLGSAYAVREQKVLVFYAINKHSAIGMLEGEKAALIADGKLLSDEKAKSFHIAPHLLEKGIEEENWYSLDGKIEDLPIRKLENGNVVLVWEGKKILLLRSRGKVSSTVVFDYALASNNALRDLKYAPRCELLIVDGSNSFYTQQKLEQQAKEMNIPIYLTQKEEALVLKH
ncbi:ComEC/Rec2 family competence protein [Flammeovirgaceae bacterium SG7u.111]|nr:ComEC/Rec2 family competence protein [Flammeovirgaceae bacterium SG7u.132]WPO34442.1 ComEC/Rec2 family competence protein [Flammeovirgaceae bacterium SG7u.111]